MADASCECDTGSPVYPLAIETSFAQLSSREKQYAHFMREAAFYGSRIISRQVSPESETIFDLVIELGKTCAGDWAALRSRAEIHEQSFAFFLEYAAVFVENLGNYKGYGDKKFIPRIEAGELKKLCSVTERAGQLYAEARNAIYSTEPRTLGYPADGRMSNYYPDSPKLSKEEIDMVKEAVSSTLSLRNTRLRKTKGNGVTTYQILVASVQNEPQTGIKEPIKLQDGSRIVVCYGDHANYLERMCSSLEKAIPYAATAEQKAYLEKLVLSYRSGDIEVHKQASIAWLADKDPFVETWSGFLEPGRDPNGVRCEFEALVAIQDKAWTAAFSSLAENAESVILQLPWSGLGPSKDQVGPFENDTFVQPSFVALRLLCYCVSNVWTGLTAPGYPDVKTEHGRKNLTFSNRAEASSLKSDVPLVLERDLASFEQHHPTCFFLQLALHELIGHGCGKLFQETEPGVFNFDRENAPTNPFTGERVQTWYGKGETPESAFGGVATAYIECLAEGIGLYLISTEDIFQILLPDTNLHVDDIVYNAYLSICCMGMRGMLSYDVESKKWGQVHDQARFGLLRCFLQAGAGLLTVECQTEPQPSLKINLDRSKILSVGRPALQNLIHKLHVFRCIKDVTRGTDLLVSLTNVDEEALKWRSVVEANKKPRPLFLQANTEIVDGEVVLKNYPATKEGLIQSWLDRN